MDTSSEVFTSITFLETRTSFRIVLLIILKISVLWQLDILPLPVDLASPIASKHEQLYSNHGEDLAESRSSRNTSREPAGLNQSEDDIV